MKFETLSESINYKYINCTIFFAILFSVNFPPIHAQNLSAGFPVFEEAVRRNQIINLDSINNSFSVRPIRMPQIYSDTIYANKSTSIQLLPILSTSQINSHRPYGWGNSLMIPNRGFQQYFNGGLFIKHKFLKFQFSPELLFAQNKPYDGYQENFSNRQNVARFFYWNWGDYPERFGNKAVNKFWWGQSKLSAEFGSFEMGLSTQNIWWGPGQWNALIFSNNAQGFYHFTFNTVKPVKTFLGNFEGQYIAGRIEESGLNPAQNKSLNDIYFFNQFSGDWKYLTGLNLTYQPKWIDGFWLGFNRTFQIYSQNIKGSFNDYFPFFEGLEKVDLGEEDINFKDVDDDGRDQQLCVFFRYVIPKFKFEFYGEYGRRDHAYNFRELFLNPEHARAYLIGFKKLILLDQKDKYVQIRSEVTHQQESINRTLRHGIPGGLTWHTHNPSRGFSNYGQPLGVGIGIGSNIQTIEVSVVENLNKMGVIIERLENNQDFYYKALLQDTPHRPWVDLSLGFLFDYQWDRLLLSSKLQYIHGRNYQWQLDPRSTLEFPKGQNLNSLHAQISLIYLWNKKFE